MECYSCYPIAQAALTIQNCYWLQKDINDCLGMCCEKYTPKVTLTDNPKENLERFLGMRHLEIIRGLQDNVHGEDNPCAKCCEYIKRDWSFSLHISRVNLSIYPSPCQCHCLYCDVYEYPCNSLENCKKNPDVEKIYENVFKTLSLAKKIGLVLRQQTQWEIANGELTINPYKKELLNLVHGERVWLFTNAFIFDKAIAQELHDNPLAAINLSIDSGTSETWRKVKGVDNFQHVLANLKAYRKVAQHSEQIILKYIILPGVNDSEEDFLSFVEIAKGLDLQSFRLSRDVREAVETAPSGDDGWSFSKTVESAARLVAICQLNGISVTDFHAYTEYEVNIIKFLTNKLLEQMR